MQYLTDDYFMKKIIKTCDFIGVNYYFSHRVYGYRIHNPDDHLNDMGWSMEPEHIQQMIERLYEKYQLPIFITENGLADAKDEYRQWWLMQTIVGINKAIASGVEVIGYLHWSLIDNFEWDKGFWPRFGLFDVDYRTMKRTPRASAVWFAKILKKIRG
jgi:beta-glucosidase